MNKIQNTTSTGTNCLCGCGEIAKGTYRPGHDARHVSILIGAVLDGYTSPTTAREELPSLALRNKFDQALANRQAKKASSKRCGCGRANKTKNTLEQNPEICDICWDEAGYENDHMDGRHPHKSMPKECPLCRN